MRTIDIPGIGAAFLINMDDLGKGPSLGDMMREAAIRVEGAERIRRTASEDRKNSGYRHDTVAVELSATDDGATWAREFYMAAQKQGPMTGLLDPTPGGFLHSWFCNAIETGRSFGYGAGKKDGEREAWPMLRRNIGDKNEELAHLREVIEENYKPTIKRLQETVGDMEKALSRYAEAANHAEQTGDILDTKDGEGREAVLRRLLETRDVELKEAYGRLENMGRELTEAHRSAGTRHEYIAGLEAKIGAIVEELEKERSVPRNVTNIPPLCSAVYVVGELEERFEAPTADDLISVLEAMGHGPQEVTTEGLPWAPNDQPELAFPENDPSLLKEARRRLDAWERNVGKLREVIAVAIDPGNAFANDYLLGMANGLILAQATILDAEGDVPYLTMPEKEHVGTVALDLSSDSGEVPRYEPAKDGGIRQHHAGTVGEFLAKAGLTGGNVADKLHLPGDGFGG